MDVVVYGIKMDVNVVVFCKIILVKIGPCAEEYLSKNGPFLASF